MAEAYPTGRAADRGTLCRHICPTCGASTYVVVTPMAGTAFHMLYSVSLHSGCTHVRHWEVVVRPSGASLRVWYGRSFVERVLSRQDQSSSASKHGE